MIQDVLDERANYFTQSYRVFNMALVGMFAQAMNESEALSQRARSQLERAVREAIHTHLSFANETVVDSTQRVSEDAVESVRNPLGHAAIAMSLHPKIENWNEAAVADMMDIVHAALVRDGNQVNRELRRFAFNVQMVMSSGTRRISAIMQTKRTFKAGLDFTYIDTLNRKWPMEVYLRAAFRGHLLNVYNDIVVMVLTSFGEDVAMIQYQDPTHEDHGEVVTLVTPRSELRSYDDVRADIFHPNSSAVLAPVPRA